MSWVKRKKKYKKSTPVTVTVPAIVSEWYSYGDWKIIDISEYEDFELDKLNAEIALIERLEKAIS